MDVLDVCVEALAVGRAYGVTADREPEAIPVPASDEHTEALTMIRNFGLVEAYYDRSPCDGSWRGTFFMLQTHRLERPIEFAAVAAELASLGHVPETVAYSDDDFVNYRFPVSDAEALVQQPCDQPFVMPGCVAKIYVPGWPRVWSSAATPDLTSIRDSLRFLVDAGAQQRDRWLARREQDLGILLEQAGMMARMQPQRAAAWSELERWLLRRAEVAQVWPIEEWTWRWLEADREHRYDPDEVVRRVVLALPLSREEAHALPDDWHRIPPMVLRRSRVARGLLRVAMTYRSGIDGWDANRLW